MVQFFETIMGRRFFESHVPKLLRELEKLNENLSTLSTPTVFAEQRTELTDRREDAFEACVEELQQLFWADGEDTEHDSDTLGEAANILMKWGFGP